MYKKKAVIIIPTYNEADVVEILMETFHKLNISAIAGWELAFLFVDGNSTDGTAVKLENLKRKYKAIEIIREEKKEGIGAAYFKGFKSAVEEQNAHTVIEFDADLQHPPESVPDLLNAIDEGYDLVLGSRKIKDGSYPKSWDKKRLFLSKFGGMAARFLLFFPTKLFLAITDPTTGLKATRVENGIKTLDFSKFHSKGFGYKLEMLYRLGKNGINIKEVPLRFNSRVTGESKMTSQTPREIFQTIFWLRWNLGKLKSFLKFCIIGATGFIVNSVALELLSGSGMARSLGNIFSGSEKRGIVQILANPNSWAAAVAAELAILNNFIFNNLWTFKEKRIKKIGKWLFKLFQFNLVSFGAIILQFIVIGSMTRLFSDTTLTRQISLIGTILFLIIPYNWFMYNHVVWRKNI